MPAADLPPYSATPGKPDPELEALPKPRRPGRTLTLIVLLLTGVASLALAYGLRSDAAYALSSGPPTEVGELRDFEHTPGLSNRWVHGEAELSSNQAIRYGRPLESDTYRLAQVAGNPKLWVQIRVPEDMEGPHFVAPTSFVGRMVPLKQASLRHQGLANAVAAVTEKPMPKDAWLLLDGETPSGMRWAIGLVLLFVAFAAFSAYGLVQLMQPVRDG